MNVMTQCEACGHPNPELSKFCGQCGHVLARVPVSVAADPPKQQRPQAVAFRPEPARPQSMYVSGPSLLGLDAASQEEDESFSYLLDEEPPSHAGRYFLFFLFVLAIAGAGAYIAYQRLYKPEPFSARAPQPIAPSFAYDHTPASVLEENKLALNAEPALPNRLAVDQKAMENIANTMRRQAAHDQLGGVANTGSDKSAGLVADGERYLYGRGAASNCKAAKQSFEDAAKQGNAAAMAHLGAMYGAGRCADFNRVTAYQWFARAKNADPDNAWIESSMDMLWRNMSAKERAAILK
jgi:hypothetical protein